MIEFTLKLDDLMSDPVKQLGGVTHSVFGGIDDDVRRTQRGFNDLGDGIMDVHEKMGMLRESAAMFFGSLAERGVERGLDFLREQVSDVFAGGMEEGTVKMKMRILGQGEGDELFENIRDYISHSMFGPELNEVAVQMEAVRMKAKEIPTYISELGDISMGDVEHLKELALALEHVASEGKLDGQVLRMFMRDGFNPLQELSVMTGKSIADLTDEMHEGKIGFKDLTAAMKHATDAGGLFHGVMAGVMETPGGKWKEMMTNIEAAKKELGVALLPSVGVLVDDLMPMVNELPAEFERMRPGIEALVMDLGELVKWVSNNTESIGHWMGVLETGAKWFVIYKTGALAVGAAMGIWSGAVKAAALVNAAFGASEVATTAAVAAEGYAVTVAAGEYEYYSTAAVSATVATEALDVAIMATPWGMIAAGVGLVSGAYLLLRDNALSADEAIRQAKTGAAPMNHDPNYNYNGYMPTSGALTAPTAAINTGMWGDPDVKKGGTKPNGPGVKDASDNIIGGGGKMVTMNFNAPLYHVDKQIFEQVKDAMKTVEDMRTELYRLLTVIPGIG